MFASGSAFALSADKVAISASALVIKRFNPDVPDPREVTLLGPIEYKVSTPTDIIAWFFTECLLLTEAKIIRGTDQDGRAGARLGGPRAGRADADPRTLRGTGRLGGRL